MVMCANCGAKVRVVDSIQKDGEHGVIIERIRVCDNCKRSFISSEYIPNTVIRESYTHGRNRSKDDD